MIPSNPRESLLSRQELPQLVPSARCMGCDVCCRFPEKTSPLAPYFTDREIQAALRRGLPPERFHDIRGGRIELIPHPAGEGYICPAFDPATNGCRIYDERPLDCRLFPLALMWDPGKTTVLLGYDRKCPFLVESIFDSGPYVHADAVADRLESDETLERLRAQAGLIGAFQEDVMILRPLPRLSRALTGRAAAGPPPLEALGLTPLTDADRPLFEAARLKTPSDLAAQSWPPLALWGDLFRYYWTVLEGQFCLFASYSDGLYMPLPPLGAPVSEAAVRRCFEIMDAANANPAVSRIENIDPVRVPVFQSMGLSIREKEREYLYDREALVRLSGGRYKAKRWACNRFESDHAGRIVRLEPYRAADREDCLGLYDRWMAQRADGEDAAEDRMMMEDAVSAHRLALKQFDRLGLTGRVVRIGGRVAGYTFGYPLRAGIFCVLLELADRSITGLAAWIYREFCREMDGYARIHAMDDAGLERLRAAKRSYHPSQELISYIAARPV